MMQKKIAIFGTAGHARDIAVCIDNREEKILVQMIAEENEAAQVQKLQNEGYAFIIGVGSNTLRQKIAERYNHLPWTAVVSSGARVAPDVVPGAGSFIGFGCYVSHNVAIGRHAIIHCNAVIGHDTVIHDYVQIAPGVCVGGNGVTLEQGVLIGANTTIINRPVTVGAWAVVGMGAHVSADIPARVSHQPVLKHVGLRNG